MPQPESTPAAAKRLALELGSPGDVLEHLTELDWAMRQGQQLRTPADVAAAAHWPGDVELFAASLVRLGYLARSADGRYLTTVAWPSVDPRFYNWLFDARLFDPDGLDDRRRTED